MAVKSLSTRIAIIGRGAKCTGGTSARHKVIEEFEKKVLANRI